MNATRSVVHQKIWTNKKYVLTRRDNVRNWEWKKHRKIFLNIWNTELISLNLRYNSLFNMVWVIFNKFLRIDFQYQPIFPLFTIQAPDKRKEKSYKNSHLKIIVYSRFRFKKSKNFRLYFKKYRVIIFQWIWQSFWWFHTTYLEC